uniref:Hexosyltransferase n=1 Tax=Eptatretus burgeri TaxID=7764 RepID=A0A8C4WZM7_EPTBU
MVGGLRFKGGGVCVFLVKVEVGESRDFSFLQSILINLVARVLNTIQIDINLTKGKMIPENGKTDEEEEEEESRWRSRCQKRTGEDSDRKATCPSAASRLGDRLVVLPDVGKQCGVLAMRLRAVLTLCRPLAPVLVGISLGFTLSLLGLSWVDEACGGIGADSDLDGFLEPVVDRPSTTESVGKAESDRPGRGGHDRDEYQPRIVPYRRPVEKSRSGKVFRPRYISSELGLRDQLLVSVLSSRSSVGSLAVAMNRTVGHHFAKVLFFTDSHGAKFPGGMTLVTQVDERPIWKMFQALHYIHEHHAAEYDWFYFVQDDAYIQEQRYRYFELDGKMDLEKEERVEFLNAYAVHPVEEPVLMYLLHKRFTQNELDRTYEEIAQLQMEIKNVSVETPEGENVVTWPVGINPPFKARTRFEVIPWQHFTEDYMFSCVDGRPMCELHGVDRADVSDILETVLERFNRWYQPHLHFRLLALSSGYRRFDPTRGMEYMLDLSLEMSTQRGNKRVLSKRVQLLRPLNTVEIVPMPYVTEGTRLHVLLPLTVHDRVHFPQFFQSFAANALDTHENLLLTLLFIYDPFDAQKVSQDDIFAEVKELIGEYQQRYEDVKFPWISVKTDVPSQIKLMDIISKKNPLETLFLVTSVASELSVEFLNRCRMNAIANWQVFFPIHFQEFDPELLQPDRQAHVATDLSREAGHFDRAAFDEACFYNSDYMAARTRMAQVLANSQSDVGDEDIFDLFVHHSSLHLFRAAEPALRHRHRHRACNPRLSEDVYHRCLQNNLQGLASHAQLATLLLQNEQNGT